MQGLDHGVAHEFVEGEQVDALGVGEGLALLSLGGVWFLIDNIEKVLVLPRR